MPAKSISNSKSSKEALNQKENSVLNITFEIEKVNKTHSEVWKQNFIIEYDDYPDLWPVMQTVKEKLFGKEEIQAVK